METMMQYVAKWPLSGLVCLVAVLLICVCTARLVASEQVDAQTGNVVTCANGMYTVTWSPSLTNAEQRADVVTKSYWGPCVSSDSDLAVSASSEQHFQATLSCQSLRNLASPITWVITWNDHVTSLYTFNAAPYDVEGLGTLLFGSGIIAQGRYQGARARMVFMLGDLEAMVQNVCASPSGMARLRGPTMLIISN